MLGDHTYTQKKQRRDGDEEGKLRKDTMLQTNGLICEVYRAARGYDSTMGGPSSYHSTMLLVGHGVDGPETIEQWLKNSLGTVYNNTHPAMSILRFVEHRSVKNYFYAEPVWAKPGTFMYGGNLLCTSDSRFPNKYPIKIHDRREDKKNNFDDATQWLQSL